MDKWAGKQYGEGIQKLRKIMVRINSREREEKRGETKYVGRLGGRDEGEANR